MQRPDPLYRLIADNFKEDFELFCGELDVDVDELSGSTRSLKAMGLQTYLGNRGRLHELLAKLLLR